MLKEDIEAEKDKVAELFNSLIGQPCTIEIFENEVAINGWVCLKVHAIDSSIMLDDDILINKEDGELGAVLCPVGAPGNDFQILEFNLHRLISYIHDVGKSEFSAFSSHSFKCHFLLVKKDFFEDYVNNFKDSSALWGGFIHDAPNISFSRKISSISVRSSIFIPSIRHSSSLATAISASTGFDRFLKYYH